MVKAGVERESLLEDSDEQVSGDRDPYLGLYGVLAGAVESFDSQVLLDPLKE